MRIWGALTPGEMHDIVTEVRTDPRTTAELRHLVDLRQLTSVSAIAAKDVRAVAADALAPSPQRAIVAPDSATFGLARMFAAIRNLKESQELIGVFRSMKEAEDWLGLSVA